MSTNETDAVFSGSIPEFYEQYLVPLIFREYAADLARRIHGLSPRSVLEIAAGTGVVTRVLADTLDRSVAIIASDLNEAMIDHARSVGTSRPVQWRRADVMYLPFADESFDAVVCQFSVMFFPDRARAMGEVCRVLRPGGAFVFNVWDCIENNELADEVTDAVGTLFPEDPPRFLARTPHGYHEPAQIQADVAAGGFSTPADFDVLECRGRAATSDIPAIAYCQGTPLRDEIEARDASRLDEATAVATAALTERFGATDLDTRIRGFVITATKPRLTPVE